MASIEGVGILWDTQEKEGEAMRAKLVSLA